MNFTKIQSEIINYIEAYEKGEKSLTPCIEVLQSVYKNKYSNLEIRDDVLELVSSGILESYSFHSYLRFTQTFISSLDHNINNRQ